MSNTLRSSGIFRADHTGFTVASLADSLHFWTEVLGFKHLYTSEYGSGEFLDNLVGVKGASLTLAMVEAPGGHLVELLEYHNPDDREWMQPRSCDVGSVHLAFTVSDLDGLLNRVEAAGWHRLGAPQTVESGERAGLKLAYARGPDGVTLESLQWPTPLQ
ncbi:VOC family protein [Pseudomonas akapageensis]|uniref:VOC family protein n=1 Tax=Pseudomonas akapageensis TaxID=2609961 RepID=UPI001408924D